MNGGGRSRQEPSGPVTNEAAICLHPQQDPFVTVSKYELDSLWKTNIEVSEQKEVLNQHVERLEDKLRIHSKQSRTYLEELRRVKEELQESQSKNVSLKNTLYNERLKNTRLEQNSALLRCQVDRLNGEVARLHQKELNNDKCGLGYDCQCHGFPELGTEPTVFFALQKSGGAEVAGCEQAVDRRESFEEPAGRLAYYNGMLTCERRDRVGPTPRNCGHNQGCNDVNTRRDSQSIVEAPAEQADQCSRQNLHNDLNILKTLLEEASKKVHNMQQEEMASTVRAGDQESLQAQQDQQAWSLQQRKEQEDKLQKMETLCDLLQRDKQSLEKQNRQLMTKLRILEGEEGEGKIVMPAQVRRSGRFEVQPLSLECTQCRKIFGSVSEMKQSVCLYHRKNPVTFVGEAGRKFWPCCEVTGAKVPDGCVQDQHRLTTPKGQFHSSVLQTAKKRRRH